MNLLDLHSFFLYVFFGHMLAYPAVALYLKYYPPAKPGQRMALYLLALLSPFIAFALYHSFLTKQCHTGFLGVAGTALGFLCNLGVLAYSYLSPLLLIVICAAILRGAAVPLYVARARRQSVKPPPHLQERVKHMLAAQCTALSLPLPEVIYSSQRGFAALIAGLVKPVLVLNAWLLPRLTDGELKAVISHELVHIRHRDTLSSFLLQILCKAAFFSPFSGLLLQRYLLEKEQRCDQEAAALLGDSHSYGAALLRVWKLLVQENAGSLALACSFTGGKGRQEMELRMTNLLQAPPGPFGRPVYLFFAFAAALPAGTVLLLGMIC